MSSEGPKGACIDCSVNPRMGRERETRQPLESGNGRTVAVVGAGPAGMSAAEELARRGFRAVVLERNGSPGGQLNLAKVPPGKAKMGWLIEDLWKAGERAGAEFRFDTVASLAGIEALHPYAVVIATGSLPVACGVPGADGDNVFTANDVLEGRVKPAGRRIAVVGSGLTGLETAEKLAGDGNRLLVVEMRDSIGPGIHFQNRDDALTHLEPFSPEYIVSHRLVSIGDTWITLEHVKTRERCRREVDLVVLAVGVRSENSLVPACERRFRRVFTAGDAGRPGRIHTAVREGFDAARGL